MRKQRKSGKGWVLASVFVLLLAACGSAAGAAYHYGKDDRLPQSFRVAGLQVGGQRPDVALAQVRARIAELEQTSVSAQLHAGDGSAQNQLPSRTFEQLGLNVSADVAIRALEAYRDRSWWQRAVQRWQGEPDEAHDVSIMWDEAVLGREAGRAWGNAAGVPAKDAKREINGWDEVMYTPEVIGKKVDLPTLTAEIKKLTPETLMRMADEKRKTVQIPLTSSAPKVTVASLKEEGIDRKIAEFTTSFASSAAGRSHNVAATAKALNDTLLMPGDMFAYDKIVDKADKKYGYRVAPVIVKGKLTPGIGGGICQVSSTLYNAILQAGLDLVERRNHSLVVHYLPPGLDATYADGYVNFRFRNSTGKQLLIRTVVRDKHLTVKLFGTLAENVTYRTETQQIKVVPPKVKYVGNAELPLGSEKRLQKGEPGYVVDTYRVKYVDGKQVSRMKLPRSSYRAQEELIAVHPDDPRLKPPGNTPPPTPAPGEEGPVEPV